MIFNSFIFIFIFFPIAWAGFWFLKNKQKKYLWLTVLGYIFYGYWNWKFLILMFVTTALDFWVAKKIGSLREDRKKAKKYLIMSIIANLGALGFFKYANFFTQSVAGLGKLFGLDLPIPILNIILPISISFYTFQAISYTVDVYRGKAEVITNFFEYSTYIALFPHLVAGPIVRYTHIAPDLKNIDKKLEPSFLFQGLNFFVIGLVKKVIIADSIATIINPMFENFASLSSLGAWLAVLGYTYQLYFDFSGYSDMAVGLAYLLGFRFPQNFNSPYKAINISDFWQRWHISLSTWLRDYLYIPLGGSRVSKPHVYINLLITMLLGGLWHGASWTFIIWGGYHGALLALYKAFQKQYDRIPVILQKFLTFVLVVIGWVFFRSTNLNMAINLLSKMFMAFNRFNIIDINEGLLLIVLIVVAAIIAHFAKNTFEIHWRTSSIYAIMLAIVFVASLVFMNYKQSVFLYYQF